MRGGRPSQPSFVRLINGEIMIAAEHVIQVGKRIGDDVLREVTELFDGICAGSHGFGAFVHRKNQARLRQHDVADLFLAEVRELAWGRDWVSGGGNYAGVRKGRGSRRTRGFGRWAQPVVGGGIIKTDAS